MSAIPHTIRSRLILNPQTKWKSARTKTVLLPMTSHPNHEMYLKLVLEESECEAPCELLSKHPSVCRRLLPLQASGQDVNLKKGVLPTDLFEDRDSESSSVVYAIVCTSMSLVGLKLK